MIFGSGRCPEKFPDWQWNPTKKPLKPARVEPWWKLWIQSELRRGDRGRPSADDLVELTDSGQ